MQETRHIPSGKVLQEYYTGQTEEETVGKMERRLQALQRKGHTLVRRVPKIGRNDRCPCGSGRKFKKCCISKVPAA